MDSYKVKPVKNKQNIEVTVPGSKSITNRALMLAAISEGRCVLKGVLFSADSRAFIDCLVKLGFEVKTDEDKRVVEVVGMNGEIPNRNAKISVGSAGTAARFLTVMLSVAGGNYFIDSSKQMKKRPMAEIIKLLRNIGVEIECLEEEGHFPIKICSKGIKNNSVSIDTETSSQYASALLMAGAMCGLTINLTGSRVDGAYINITLNMLKQFGVDYQKNEHTYIIQKQKFELNGYQVEPDMSGACYFYAMALLLRTKTCVLNLHMNSMQGDIKFIDVLKELGCIVYETENGILVDGSHVEYFNGIDVDMKDFSDQTMTMAVVAAFARTQTIIRNIGHIKFQESNRVQATVDELTRLGIDAYEEIEEDITEQGKVINESINIVINPGKIQPALIETYDDHRIAMAFALAGLVEEGIEIANPMCCKKTFENYFDLIDEITK